MSFMTRVLGDTYMTQPFIPYQHYGVDLVCWHGYCDLGDIYAHSDGVVEGIRNDCGGYEEGSYGNYVLIRHDNDMRTLYAHGAYGSVCVGVGQRVLKGQKIMYMGNTGHSFGGHLHFEIREPNGVQIDPEPYLNTDLPNGSGKITVDGMFGHHSVSAMQKVLKNGFPFVTVDGIVSSQPHTCQQYLPACMFGGWEFVDDAKGSPCIEALQKTLNDNGCEAGLVDGKCGYNTVCALQRFLKQRGYDIEVDGYWGTATATAYQQFLNTML